MKIVFYGNCQVSTLGEYAKWHSTRHQIEIITNYAEFVRPDGLERTLRAADGADFIFYQPIDGKYGGFATTEADFFRQFPDVPRLSIPYIYNNAMWSTFFYIRRWHEHEMIKVLLAQPSQKKAQAAYLRGDLDFEFPRRWVDTTQYSAGVEAATDVKVLGYIGENFRAKKLFLTHNHPASPIYAEIVRQIGDAVTDLFPSPSKILELGDDVLPYKEYEIPVELSAHNYWRYEWTDAHSVARCTKTFLDQWDAMIAGAHP
jgi:hypothetical protein